MRKSGYRVSNDSGNKTENMKRRHDEANQGSGGRIGPSRTCQFKRKSTEGGWHCVTDCRQVMTVLQPFVMNRLDICRQRTTSLLASAPEKDTHAQNRERVPLKYLYALYRSTLTWLTEFQMASNSSCNGWVIHNK